MEKDFLLTYSVKNKHNITEYVKSKADKVRRDIAALSCWKKLKNVETTFYGEMVITCSCEADKQSQAENNVRDVFVPILEKHGVNLDVTIQCAIMVESISGVHEFKVGNAESPCA